MLVFIVLNNPAYFLSHRLGLAREIAKHGARVAVVAPDDPVASENIRRLGFDFHPWRLDRGSTNPLREARAVWDLVSIYKRHRPDLVHHITPKPVLYGSHAARWAKIPAYVNALTGLGYLFTGSERNIAQSLYGSLQRRCHQQRRTRTIFQNPDDLDLFIEQGYIDREHARLIRGSGVDPSYFRPGSSGRTGRIILLPSRMLFDKGVGDTVEAVRLLRERGLSCELWLAGDSDPANPRAVPEGTLRAWHEQGQARWLGHVKDMVELLHQVDVVCLPSFYREGVPKALIEAASCALPIVTTDTPGCREIVRNGVNGYLVEPRNPASIAEALGKLLGNAGHARQLGNAGRELVLNEFSLDRVNERTVAVYAEVHPFFRSGKQRVA